MSVRSLNAWLASWRLPSRRRASSTQAAHMDTGHHSPHTECSAQSGPERREMLGDTSGDTAAEDRDEDTRDDTVQIVEVMGCPLDRVHTARRPRQCPRGKKSARSAR